MNCNNYIVKVIVTVYSVSNYNEFQAKQSELEVNVSESNQLVEDEVKEIKLNLLLYIMIFRLN